MYFAEKGSGKTVVYLHGWGCDGSIFLPVANKLPRLRNVLVDMRGFGKSDPPPASGWRVADYAEDLYDFFQKQGIDRATLVCHSFGCRVALVFAATHPDRAERLLLVAPAGIRRFSLKRWLRVRRYKIKKFFGKTELSHASDDYLNCNDALRATFVKVVNEDLSRYAKRVICPALIVAGRNDEAVPLWQARTMGRLIRQSSLAEIDGDHFAFFRSPVAFAQTIQNFVE